MYQDFYYDNYEVGKVIVALHKDFANQIALRDIRSVLDQLDYEKAEVIFHLDRSKNKSDVGDILLIYLNNKDKLAVVHAIEKLSAIPYVIYAEPDYLETLHVIPDDPLYGQLWGMQKIGVTSAWEYSTGSDSVSVGVIDTGIDYHHPDMRKNMWSAPKGRPAYGWNFADDNRDPMDTDGHGTHVAGTIGAVGNNDIGITGVCWNVKVAALKFGLDIASAIEAINFANLFHISILNASWGGRSYSQSLKYAIDQYQGLFIASAGNNGTSNEEDPIYPASYDSDNLITVASTSPDNSLSRFSNYGVKSVDIAAPGSNILSLGLEDEYNLQNGTSMSAPHVAGAAALLKSYKPNLSVLELKNIILYSAVRNPDLIGKVLTGGMLDVKAMFELADYEQHCE